MYANTNGISKDTQDIAVKVNLEDELLAMVRELCTLLGEK